MYRLNILCALVFFIVGPASADDNLLPNSAMICTTCHGIDGISIIGTYPNLRGQKEKYLIKQITDFKSGVRVDPLMSPMASLLLEKDMAAVVKYFSELK
jgi:cytochrome c553